MKDSYDPNVNSTNDPPRLHHWHSKFDDDTFLRLDRNLGKPNEQGHNFVFVRRLNQRALKPFVNRAAFWGGNSQ